MNEQFQRQVMLTGKNALDQLHHSHVAVFGVGGVGSFCAEALARAGIGSITLVDDDVVSKSNINRQLIALHSTIGKAKTEIMAARIADINPDCKVTGITARYEPSVRDSFFGPKYDFIADAIDSVACKIDLIETSIHKNIPIISAMGTGNKLDPTKFEITDISKTSGCPLARVVRKELRDRGILHHTVLYSTELPIKPITEYQQPGERPVPGSVSWVPSSAGLLIAGYIIQSLINRE